MNAPRLPGLGPLNNDARVIIIGGGPGGTACAIALQRLATQMGRSLQVTILEGKEFRSELHYNQCAGVLSPPLPQLLEEELDVPFPHHLSRSAIEGYPATTELARNWRAIHCFASCSV